MNTGRKAGVLAALVFLGIVFLLGLSEHERPSDSAPKKAIETAGLPAGSSRTSNNGSETPQKKRLHVDEFLAQHDLCAIFHNEAGVDPDELVERVMKAPDLYSHEGPKDVAYNRVIDALFAPDAEQALDRLAGEDESDPTVLLYRGLIAGGLIEGKLVPKSGFPPQPLFTRPFDAIRDLEKAREADPGNGAYSFFLAHLKEQRGFPADEIRRELLQAASAPKFETYIVPLMRRVFEKGMNSPAHYILAGYMTASFPIPNYSPWRLFSQHLEGDPELAESAIELGKHMMEPTRKYGLERETAYWMAIEHQVGLALFKRAWQRARPDESAPPEFLMNYQDWSKLPGSVQSSADILDSIGCSNAWVKSNYERDKAFFQKFMSGA